MRTILARDSEAQNIVRETFFREEFTSKDFIGPNLWTGVNGKKERESMLMLAWCVYVSGYGIKVVLF